MRFWFNEPFIDPSHYLPLVREVEAAGFDGVTLADNLGYPESFESDYPYFDGGNEFMEDKPVLDPYTLAAAIGAATTTLQVAAFVVKLPMRPPVLSAKAAASVAALTGGRFLLGVGLSPWEEDYVVCGVDPNRKGARLDEAIAIVEGLLAGGYHEHHGDIYDLPSFKMAPAPATRVPILVGGHSDAALERAVRIGDGWMHAGGTPEELDGMLARLEVLKERRPGGYPEGFRTFVHAPGCRTVEGVEALRSRGVTDAIVSLRDDLYAVGPDTQPLQDKIDGARRFGAEVIAELR